jgi:uncharacterized protein (TIGR02145 family)
MKNIFRFSGVLVQLLLILVTYSCKRDKPAITTITTTPVTELSSVSATSGGKITNNGGAPIISRGVCWGTSFDPTVEDSKTNEGSGSGSFISYLTQLEPNTFYYLRAYATNDTGTFYGNQINFTTFCDDKTCTVWDDDGNMYNTITIGTQIWMKENLKTTKFSNGTDIPLVTSSLGWYYLTTPGYCWYGNDANNKATYGALYNWYAVNVEKNGNRNVCPPGWHVPADNEWTILMTYLGGDSVAVGKLKETGTFHWQYPNSDATDESGFTALPGGARDFDGVFYGIGSYGYWWSATEFAIGGAWSRYIGYDGSGGDRHGNLETDGFSVRCVKNNESGK